MKTTQAQYKASQKYRYNNVTQLNISLNNKTDKDVIDWLKTKSNKAKYIKDLIRGDIKSSDK